MKQKYTLSIFFLLIIGFSTVNNSYGQSYADAAKKAMEAKRQKKISKSPASFEIQSIERNLEALEKLNKSDDETIIKESYEKLEVRVDSLNSMLTLLKTKDPKWKTEEFEASKVTYESRLENITPAYKKHNRIAELAESINEIKSHPASCDLAVLTPKIYYKNLLACGKKTMDYYVTKYNVHETIALIEEMNSLDPEWMKSHSTRIEMGEFYMTEFKKTLQENITNIPKYAIELRDKEDLEYKVADYWFYLQYLDDLNQAMLAIAPEQKELIAKGQTEIDNTKAHIQNTIISKNITMSKDRLGKIFFTKEDAEKEDFDTAPQISSWDLKTPLFYRFFLDKTPAEYDLEIAPPTEFSHNNAHVEADIYFDDKLINTEIIMDFDRDFYYLFRTFRIQHDLRYVVSKQLMNLEFGTYKLRVELFIKRDNHEKRSSRIATNEIDINFNSTIFSNLKNNEEICLEKAKMNNSGLASECLALVKKAQRDGHDYFEATDKFSIVRIVSSEWWIKQNQYTGLPVSKSIDILVAGKDKDGNCIQMVLGIKQDHAGGGKYSSKYVSSTGGRQKIPCFCF